MSYDDLDRLVGVTAGSAQGGNAVFAYDVLDNIRQLDQGTRTVRHTYNTSNRISAIKDAAGNTLSTYVQDTRGNLVQRITGTVIDTFTFDKANRLKATTINGVSSVYGYDGLGRRMQQAEAGVSSYFVYGQAGQLLFSQDATTRYNHIHLAGSLVAKRLVPFSGTTSIRYQHTDALGSPVAETSETGAVLQRERMTAYGEPADGTWQAGPGFTGHQMDASSKLVYMQQRYYDPMSGMFLSTDSMESDAENGWNFNRYNYAANNPYRFTDPDGRKIFDDPWARADTLGGPCDLSPCAAGVAGRYSAMGPPADDMKPDEADSHEEENSGENVGPAEPMFCSGGADCDFMYNQNEYLNGDISGDEFLDRTQNQGIGGMTGAAVAGLMVTKGGGIAALRSMYLFVKKGREIKIGNNWRFAPFGNRTGDKLGRWPHYHRRGLGKSGITKEGQGIGRHRPWEKSVKDKTFWDRF